MTDFTIDPEQPIAWRVVRQDTPIRTTGGETVGTLFEMLDSEAQDIFHGIVVHLVRLDHHVFVPAGQVTLMTLSHIDVALTSEEIHALPEHAEDQNFHLGRTGLFGRKIRWIKDEDR